MQANDNAANYIHTVSDVQRRMIYLLGSTVRHWQRTLTYLECETFASHITSQGGGSLILMWHNRLFGNIGCLNALKARGRKVYGLVSASKDGAQLACFLNAQGIETVRGSSSRRGMVATRELVSLLKRGDHVAITIDGPRGPCYKAQPGAAFLAQLAKVPVCLLGAEFEVARELNSWDRFIVPMPFSRIRMRTRIVHPDNLADGQRDRESLRLAIEREMLAITADRHRE